MRSLAGGRGVLAALLALGLVLPTALGLSGCASRAGAQRALADGMVTRDRASAGTPDDLQLNRPAWRRDFTPAGDP